MKMNIKRLSERAIVPTRGSQFSAGADLYACLPEGLEELIIAPGETVFIKTGFAFEIPDTFVGLVFARSGLASKRGLAPANKVGVIDSDYRGDVTVALHNHSASCQKIQHGERIAQIVFVPFLNVDFDEVEELSLTERNEGGFGSTGKL